MKKVQLSSILFFLLFCTNLITAVEIQNSSNSTNTTVLVVKDDNFKLADQNHYCWNVELDDETQFCFGMINYPITEELYYNSSYYDSLAKSDYRKLLQKWRMTQVDETLTDPTSDCLAFSRYFFCSYYFPRCDSQAKPAQPMCDYVCAIYLLRCPFED